MLSLEPTTNDLIFCGVCGRHTLRCLEIFKGNGENVQALNFLLNHVRKVQCFYNDISISQISIIKGKDCALNLEMRFLRFFWGVFRVAGRVNLVFRGRSEFQELLKVIA